MHLGLPNACFYDIIIEVLSFTGSDVLRFVEGGIHMLWIDGLLVFISLVLIALVMIQESKDDVKNTFSGEKSELFKNQKQRGPELFFARATLVTSIVFGVLSIVRLIL